MIFKKFKGDGKFTPDHKPEKKEKAKPKPIPTMSEKRKKDNKVYLTLNKVYLESHPVCEARLSACTGQSEEVHHKYSGKDRGKHYLDINTWLAVCGECHRYIHKNPKETREKKLLM